MKDNQYYVVEVTEHLRDGTERFAQIVDSKDKALEVINEIANYSFARANKSFRLFELGKEITLNRTIVKETVIEKVNEKVKFS